MTIAYSLEYVGRFRNVNRGRMKGVEFGENEFDNDGIVIRNVRKRNPERPTYESIRCLFFRNLLSHRYAGIEESPFFVEAFLDSGKFHFNIPTFL
jgi:hypothetical protein